ncbi:hypothetical protein CROQUDRAFT_685151 [Cronartium quercuum f. sp. fusiforme G11]|uniref:Protein-tyrosine-phosphatase n=1 Tax=Cronartium quercuum f. sp. fusiforme G11 TaxID=708437 RepID=A0A9P6NCA1_9BASI|nr:hypothetical protein CROQUDRAFT_685151 [Cronartium quercuum f. sp. fusiforme G11]
MIMFNQSSPPSSLAHANAAIPSHLHPVALRSTAKASSPLTTAASQLAEAQLRVCVPPTRRSPSITSAASSPSPSSPSSSASSSRSPGSSDAHQSIYGLNIDHSAYRPLSALHPTAPHAESIRLITCAEYADIYERYLRSAAAVDEKTVFPYLHCPDRPGTAQASYFSQSKPAARHPPPAYRGLTVLTADPVLGPRPSRTRSRSLGSASTASASTSSSSAPPLSATSSPATSVDGPEPRASLLTSALAPEQVLERDPASGALLGRFVRKPMPSSTVNLRLFGHQPGQYAGLSDVVVYAEAGLSAPVLELAALVVEAQAEFKKRAAPKLEYHVLVVCEEFEVFEREHGALVAVDGWGFKRSKVDFFERERLEMESLTRASEIEENVWFGNTADAMRDQEQAGHGRFSVMIEAHDSARIPSESELESVVCNLLARPRKAPSSYRPPVHLEVPSTGPAAGQSSMDLLVRSLQEFCGWVSRIAGSGHKILVHCHDGYTETSLFGLAYLIHRRRCPLSAAYLHLQLHANRSFFLYPSDLTLLRYFERRCSYADPSLPAITRSARWLEDGFEGHFPSRILPFLYLGNLAHASNLGMLRALGITAVVSMGESVGGALAGAGIAHLDVRAVADDGLDRISAHLPSTLAFIERARVNGGKVLVHCRVGVSRSATVVIAYVMAHCNVDLAAAYLLVRSRRLNILIQPNLVFMWALRRWEAQLAFINLGPTLEAVMHGGQCNCGVCGDEADGRLVRRRVGGGAWSWSALANEISLLNQRYLC